MSDNEQEWKPNPRRPQSTMAQAFSLALDSAFSLDNDVSDLSLSIEQKRTMMTIQERELQALQEKIRAAEERLKQRDSRSNTPTTLAERGGRPEQEGESNKEGDQEERQQRDPALLSSPISEEHQSDEDTTDSSTSAATSQDEAGSGSDAEPEEKQRKK